MKILPTGWDDLHNDSLQVNLDESLKINFALSFLKHPITLNLKYLTLSSVKLTGQIPKEIGHLVKLTEMWFLLLILEISATIIWAGPFQMKFGYFHICQKCIATSNCSQLQKNMLEGIIPKEIEQLKSLRHLDISLNCFTSFNSYSIYNHVQKA